MIVGDQIECIDNSKIHDKLTVRSRYIVLDYEPAMNMVLIVDDTGSRKWFQANRFIVVARTVGFYGSPPTNLPSGIGNIIDLFEDDEEDGITVEPVQFQAFEPKCDCGGAFAGGTHMDDCELVRSGAWTKFLVRD